MRNQRMIGLISDTHGLLRPQALRALEGRPSRTEKGGVLFLNPGSAGPRRFDLPVTVARLDLSQKPWSVAFVDLLEQFPK